uniref:Putative secreted protein n=1 Tax=Amblyomma triste TaxID=251400 RepID=A0A023G3T6_AMBTT
MSHTKSLTIIITRALELLLYLWGQPFTSRGNASKESYSTQEKKKEPNTPKVSVEYYASMYVLAQHNISSITNCHHHHLRLPTLKCLTFFSSI